MAEKIGLEAVLQLNSFQSAVKTYNQAISGMSKNTASTASSISSSFVSLGSGILKVGAIAAGAGLVGITALTGGLLLLGSTALTEFAKYERMALSIQSLVARELSQGKLVEQQRTVAISLTKKEAQELEGLAGKIHDEELARDTLHARIKEQSEALRQLRNEQGEDSLKVQTQTARLAQLENQYNKSGDKIEQLKNRQNELSDSSERYTTVIDKVRTGQISMTEAMAQAGPRAQELLKWIQLLAIQSPFDSEGVANTFRTALAYGFTTKEAQRLTEAEIDFTSATGRSVQSAELIALALGQVKARGKVLSQELRQLSEQGVGTNQILEEMGFTLKDVENGLVPVDEFLEAVIKDMEIFKGAGKASATTFAGLITSLSEIKSIALREFFTGTFQAIQPYLASFVEMLTRASLETGSIRALGDAFGTYVTAGLQSVVSIVTKLTSAFSRFGVRGAAVSLMGMLGFSQEDIGTVSNIIRTVTAEITRLQEVFQKFGASGVAFSIGGLLGLDSDTMISIQQTLTTIIDSISNFSTQVKGFLSELGVEELQGALIAIGAIVATGVIAALVAGIASLITPFGLLTAAVVTLSMAWAGNWGDIQGITQQAITTITDLFTQFTTIWTQNWPIIQAVALTAWEIIKGIYAGFVTALTPVITQLQAQFTQIGASLSQLGLDWSDVWNAIVTATGIVAAAIGAAILGIIAVVAGLATGIASGVSAAITMFQELSNNFAGIINGMAEILRGWVTVVSSILAGDWANAWNGFLMVLEGGLTFWSNITAAAINILKGATNVMLSTVSGFVEGVIGFFQGLYDELVGNSIIPDMVNDIVKWFKDMPQKILTGMGDLVGKISAPFEDVWKAVKDAINIDEWMQLGTDAINGLLEGMKAKAGDVLEFLKNLAADSLAGLGQFWGAESPARKFIPLGESVPQGLTVGINKAAPGFNNALTDLGQSAINSLMTGMTVTDPSFIHNFIDDLNMGGIGKAAGAGGGQWRNFRNILINEITAGMSGLEAGTINFMDKITEVANRFQFPPNLAREFAEAEGLVDHLTGTFSVMFQKLRIENLSTSVGLASQFAGIGAGFSDMIKEQVEGFNKFKESTVEVTEDLVKLREEESELQLDASEVNTELENQATKLSILQTELTQLTTAEGANQLAVDKKRLAIEKANESLAFGERQMAIYQQELDKLTAAENPSTLKIEKKILAMDRLTEAMDAQRKQLVTLEEELKKLTAGQELDTVAIEKKKLEIEKLIQAMEANELSIADNQKALEANRLAIEANEKALRDYRKELEKKAFQGSNPFATEDEKLQSDLAAIELLQDFLKSSGKELRIVGEELGGVFAGSGLTSDIVYSRVQAQKELNRLLAEEAQRQQEILNIEKAQKQLDFLNNQINLLKMLSDRGLNPRQILGGIKLGIDASASDLLAATNRVVQAMVNQINSDLQIASPSKVMARIGGQVVAGMAQGIERGRMMLTDTVRNIPLLNGSIPQPVFSQQGGMSSSVQNTYNYNMPMTVNTAASASGVIRQYEVKRSMYAN